MMLLDEAQSLALSGHRSESWRFDVLDLADQKIGELDGVTEGSFDFSTFATIKSSGSITCVAPAVDWLRVRVQPWYTMTALGQSVSWPIGVFIPASPGVDYSAPGGVQTLELYDKLLILDQDRTDGTYSVSAGAVVTDVVRGILRGVGETRDAITDSAEKLKSAMVWEADTSKLKIVNELLDAINYFSLWADGHGVFHAAPYVAPGGRGIAWEFADDEHGIYSPDFTLDADTFNVPNRVVQVSTSDGETPALIGEARNEDPASPYSYNNRGRWITRVETEVEATSQAVLDALAQRRLVELSAVTETYEIEHALIPLELNDAVRLTRTAEEIQTGAVVQKMTISTAVGALVRSTLRGVSL
ncbi:minor tail protein [Arthrobacter phage CallinAllBarbz]|uniref:Minor tail protein n=1 Tax=Arthrobacter phage CallinAllBarbz TaxID=3077790 RepID=A0AA96HD75_9CAUD|nr:minor tail protein [Arthrobacter phage CallinAllBarbz]